MPKPVQTGITKGGKKLETLLLGYSIIILIVSIYFAFLKYAFKGRLN